MAIPGISEDYIQLNSPVRNPCESYLPDETILEIFSHLNLHTLTECRLVARRFSKIDELELKKILEHMRPFGNKEWEAYFGEVGNAPPFPSLNVLKEIYKTYMLVLLPETVDGKPLTLNLFKTLAENPKGGGRVTKIEIWRYIVAQYGDVANGSSRWVLFPKDFLEGTRGKDYAQQQNIVVGYSAKKGADYEVAHGLEAIVSIASRHVQLGERLFTDCYMRCQERVHSGYGDCQLVIRYYVSNNLDVNCHNVDLDNRGVAAVRR